MTLADLAVAALLKLQTGATVGMLLVFALRGPVRRVFGAELAYRLWGTVPAAAVVGLFPSFRELVPMGVGETLSLKVENADLLLLGWIAGAVLTAGLMALSEAGFRRMARKGVAGPAVMGVFWPRLVTPADFEQRFSADERSVIRRHESAHIALGHPFANLIIALLQVSSWFNPLVHLAAAAARLDQELACDASVIEKAPGLRRLYGETLLKAHLTRARSPLVCAWFAPSRHPLETRLGMLSRRPLTLAHYLRGAMVVAMVGAIAAAGVVTYGPTWTDAPRFTWPSWAPAAVS